MSIEYRDGTEDIKAGQMVRVPPDGRVPPLVLSQDELEEKDNTGIKPFNITDLVKKIKEPR
jgi:hypothetical protein